MSDSDISGLETAFREAEAARQEGEIPVGAALYHGDTLLWADHNRREQLRDPTAHAEMLCLRKGAGQRGDWRLPDCTLYVTLEPCPMCAGAVLMSRVGRVVFAAADPAQGCCGSVYDLPADPALHGQTRWLHAEEMQERSRALLSAGFSRERKKPAGKQAQKAENVRA